MAEDEFGKNEDRKTREYSGKTNNFPGRVKFHWLAILAGSSGGLAVGASVGLTSVLIPSLQAEQDENISLDLEQGSWLGELIENIIGY